MKPTPLNQDMQSQVGPDNYPLDWKEEVTVRGLSRNLALRLYVVQLAVAGKQHFLGNAYSQKVGAKLYDYALWKFAGKMSRRSRVNFPEEFAAITQEVIDRDAPRLNELYKKIPYIKLGDEQVPEHELRQQRLASKEESAPQEFYLTHLARLKRLRLAAGEAFVFVSEGHAKLDLRKHPHLSLQHNGVESAYAQLSKKLLDLEASMESQHDYYRKLKYEKI